MYRTQLRLAGFAVVLGVLFAGGWAVGDRFPVDDDQTDHPSDHGTDHPTDRQDGDQP